jgi:hypothetical protein
MTMGKIAVRIATVAAGNNLVYKNDHKGMLIDETYSSQWQHTMKIPVKCANIPEQIDKAQKGYNCTSQGLKAMAQPQQQHL